jgi:glutamate-1-semialdehyde 2,1-aminomutase
MMHFHFPDASSRSARLFKRARDVMPGGNSRQTVMFSPYPVYAATGAGCRVTDVDGVERIDFINNYSSLIHGHGHAGIQEAVRRQLGRLTAVGLPTESEIELAEFLCARYSVVEQLRFLNSGSEAVMLAVKTARAVTGRPKIAKVEGAYHGLYDVAEISQAPTADAWGPDDAPCSVPLSPGTPAGITNDVVVIPFNRPEAATAILNRHATDIAAVLIDVMPAHLGYLQASAEFLDAITRFTKASGALLVLDEVYSLRLHHGGAYTKYGLKPDLMVMGKIMGGGFPVGAIGGSREVMKIFESGVGGQLMPHGGTYNANPITMTAGLAAMQAFDVAAVNHVNQLGERARTGMRAILRSTGTAVQVFGDGSLMCLRFTARAQRDYRDFALSSAEQARRDWFHRRLLNRGILCSPHGLFILSTAMGEAEISQLLDTASAAFTELKQHRDDAPLEPDSVLATWDRG